MRETPLQWTGPNTFWKKYTGNQNSRYGSSYALIFHIIFKSPLLTQSLPRLTSFKKSWARVETCPSCCQAAMLRAFTAHPRGLGQSPRWWHRRPGGHRDLKPRPPWGISCCRRHTPSRSSSDIGRLCQLPSEKNIPSRYSWEFPCHLLHLLLLIIEMRQYSLLKNYVGKHMGK